MCLSHLIYTLRQCLIHTCHAAPMPCMGGAWARCAMCESAFTCLLASPLYWPRVNRPFVTLRRRWQLLFFPVGCLWFRLGMLSVKPQTSEPYILWQAEHLRVPVAGILLNYSQSLRVVRLCTLRVISGQPCSCRPITTMTISNPLTTSVCTHNIS